MGTPEAEARLSLAEKLRESADHSSEQELRDALSRSYYSVYHAARVLVGKEQGRLKHGELQDKLKEISKRGEIDEKLAEAVKELYRLRENADYTPEMVIRDYGSDLERFRSPVAANLEKGRETYRQIVSLIEKQPDSNGASDGKR